MAPLINKGLRRLAGIWLFSSLYLTIATDSRAQSPVGISLIPKVSIPPKDWSVIGVRLNLITGWHQDMFGLDLGVVGNFVNYRTVGTQIAGVFNSNWDAYIVGAQIAGITNINQKSSYIYGAQIAGLANANKEGHLAGLQLSMFNSSPAMSIVGIQAGIINQADHVIGLQIGLINSAKRLTGIQIGLLNFDEDSWLPFFPLLNIGL